MNGERLYVVTYDIRDPKRWRRVYRLLQGYGAWLQLSVFQCRLSRKRLIELRAALEERIRGSEDHVLILDLGPAERVELRVESLGRSFQPVKREPVVV